MLLYLLFLNNEGGVMMDEKKECLPEGVVTMLLQGYVNTIKSLKNALYLAIASQIVTMVAFAWYVISR